MLYTNLKHIENNNDYANAINKDDNAIIVCGNMAPESISTYRIAEELSPHYANVNIYDMEYNHPDIIRQPECLSEFDPTNIPYIAYYKEGKLLEITSGNHTKSQITASIQSKYE
ncbi:thioredoxin [bacterium]|nr:thioredoxin [bacterium]